MRRLILVIATAAAIGALGAATALAFGGSELSASACGGGKRVINVVQNVLDDRDDGVNGNVWASTNYRRQIQVWQTGDTTFCATTNYEGQFTSCRAETHREGRASSRMP